MAESWASRQTRAYAESVLAPLDPAEADRAVREALAAVMRTEGAVPDRLTIYPAALDIRKPSGRDGPPTRLVWVRIRDRDRRIVHEMLVQDGTIVEHQTSETASPPFSDLELDTATEVLAGLRFARLLRAPDVEIELYNPGHGPSRLLGARFVRVEDNHVVEVLDHAVIDLDEEHLVEGEVRRG